MLEARLGSPLIAMVESGINVLQARNVPLPWPPVKQQRLTLLSKLSSAGYKGRRGRLGVRILGGETLGASGGIWLDSLNIPASIYEIGRRSVGSRHSGKGVDECLSSRPSSKEVPDSRVGLMHVAGPRVAGRLPRYSGSYWLPLPPLSPGRASRRSSACTAPGSPASDFAHGLFRQRKFDLAAEEYQRFLEQVASGPDADDARFGLASAQLYRGKYKEARGGFEDFLAKAPRHARARSAWYRLGELSYMLGDLTAARKALETFVAGPPGHTNLETGWTYLGDVCLAADDLAAARKAYERALADFPQGQLADRSRYGLARTLAALGEADAALKILGELARGGHSDWVGPGLAPDGEDPALRRQFRRRGRVAGGPRSCESPRRPAIRGDPPEGRGPRAAGSQAGGTQAPRAAGRRRGPAVRSASRAGPGDHPARGLASGGRPCPRSKPP